MYDVTPIMCTLTHVYSVAYSMRIFIFPAYLNSPDTQLLFFPKSHNQMNISSLPELIDHTIKHNIVAALSNYHYYTLTFSAWRLSSNSIRMLTNQVLCKFNKKRAFV